MSKQLLFDKNALDEIMKGLDLTANAVTGTIGPLGRNGFIDDPVQPKITNDGKNIASGINLKNPFQNLGAWVVKNTADQQVEDAGDGSTTVTALLQSIIHEARQRPENATEVSKSLKLASEGVIKAIKSKSKKVENIKQVALTSTEDEELASVIAEVVGKVGEKGTILVEENNEPKLDFEIVNGYEANVGFMSQYFANVDGKPQAEFKNVPVFCTEKKIANVGDIEPLFTQLKEKKITQVVIVCEDIDPTMLGIFIQNKLRGLLNILVIRATGPLLQDIASAVGATVVSDSMGVSFENFKGGEHLGEAQKIVCTEKKTVFLSDSKSAGEQADRLEKAATLNPNKWEAKKYMERVAKLRGGMAVIRVGAPTTLTIGYLKDKAEDAVRATQAALEEGVVEGGGMTLWRIAQEMKGKSIGEQILKKALQAPLKKICENAGKDYTEMVSHLLPNEGYNAKTDEYVDMFKEGIIDPAKVERCAVINAVENASKFITSHVAIVEEPIETK